MCAAGGDVQDRRRVQLEGGHIAERGRRGPKVDHDVEQASTDHEDDLGRGHLRTLHVHTADDAGVRVAPEHLADTSVAGPGRRHGEGLGEAAAKVVG